LNAGSHAFHHIFDRVYDENGIEHRLTKFNHPWTTNVIDKRFFGRFCDILLLRMDDRVAKSRI